MTRRRFRPKSPVDSRLTEEALLEEPGVKEVIDELTRRGAQRDELVLLASSIPGASKEAEPLVVGINERKLRVLPDRINELSDQVRRINESPFLTPRRLRDLASDGGPEWAETTSNCFLAIPNLLHLYAEHLRVWLDDFHPNAPSRRKIPRNYFRMQRLLTLRLLRLVRDATGKPCYSEVATLLDAAYRIGGEPKVIDAEGLKKLEKNAPLELRVIARFLHLRSVCV